MTTRFKREDLTEGITGAIHETGHALYEQVRSSPAGCTAWLGARRRSGAPPAPIPLTSRGVPACGCPSIFPHPAGFLNPRIPVCSFLSFQGRNLDHVGLPVNQAAGMGVHESQSLLWERMVALGRPFAAYLLPLMREHFPEVRLRLICGALQ